MKKLIAFLVIFLFCATAYATPRYCVEFGSEASIACYGPSYPPAGYATLDSPTFTTSVTVPSSVFIHGEKFSKSFVITNPTATADLPLWRAPVNFTITATHILCKTQIITGQLWQFDANGLNGATVGADMTGVVDTNVNNGALAGAAITAGNYLGWNTTSATAGATYAIITFEGYYA